MPDMKLKIPIGYYVYITDLLSKDISGDDSKKKLLDMFTQTASIINESRTNIQNVIVSVKIDKDLFAEVLSEFYPADENIKDNEYAKIILSDWSERIDQMETDAKEKAEYETWLSACFDKYVNNADISCKEVADEINKNEQKYVPVKYQNIMRQLKLYKKEKYKSV